MQASRKRGGGSERAVEKLTSIEHVGRKLMRPSRAPPTAAPSARFVLFDLLDQIRALAPAAAIPAKAIAESKNLPSNAPRLTVGVVSGLRPALGRRLLARFQAKLVHVAVERHAVTILARRSLLA